MKNAIPAEDLPHPNEIPIEDSGDNTPITNPISSQANDQEESPLEVIEEEVRHWIYDFLPIWKKIAAWLLTAHVVYGIWEAVYFIFIEYRHLEDQLKLHLVESREVHEITVSAIILMIGTAINIFMAARLHSTKEEDSALLDLIVATILIIMTPFLHNLLGQLPILQLIEGNLSNEHNLQNK